MKPRRLVIIHNNIGDHSATDKIAASAVCDRLERGWQATAVGRDLDASLGVVEHRQSSVPPSPEPPGRLDADLIERPAHIAKGCQRLVERLDPDGSADQLFADLDEAAERHRSRR